jgi:hypothetical protein
VPLKASSPNDVSVEGSVNDVIRLQPLNAASPILIREQEGSTTNCRPEQFKNAFAPIFSKFDRIVKEVMPELENAIEPNSTTLAGISIERKDPELGKPTSITDAKGGKITFVRLV